MQHTGIFDIYGKKIYIKDTWKFNLRSANGASAGYVGFTWVISLLTGDFTQQKLLCSVVNNLLVLMHEEKCVLILFDLNAEFDMVNHNLLLQDCESIEIVGYWLFEELPWEQIILCANK